MGFQATDSEFCDNGCQRYLIGGYRLTSNSADVQLGRCSVLHIKEVRLQLQQLEVLTVLADETQ
jgi:hypothetical protein